jgi:L-threonylcarbamoyladenylate synthase
MPVAAPSANRFTELSPVSAAHVVKSLGDRVDLVLDGGPTSVGIESAVVDCTTDPPVLLRPGALSAAHLAAIVGHALAAPAPAAADDAPRPSPGMIQRHYAPRATLQAFDSGSRDAAGREASRLAASGTRVGAVCFAPLPGVPAPSTIRMPADASAYAARIYDALHTLDDAGCTVVFVERVPGGGEWNGVRDRLDRAMHP